MIERRSLSDVRFLGAGLQRPECVLATRRGVLYCSDREGYATIAPDGAVTRVRARGAPEHFLPNGIALLPDGDVLIADLGLGGGVWRMAPDGAVSPFLLEVDGMRLHPTNFVGLDRAGRTWITVSTRLVPRERAMVRGYGDGYVVLVDADGARIVAEGIGFTNEAIPDPAGRFLYVNETQGRRISRLPILADGPSVRLGARETVCEFDEGIWPDGMAHDAEGGVWVVSVVSNRVLRIDTATGAATLVLEDADAADVAAAEAAWRSGAPMPRPLLDIGGRRTLGNASSLAFGGPDLRTLYIGTLQGSRIGAIDSPVRGAEPVQWGW
jgi:sugar lactone lactonase YvrE